MEAKLHDHPSLAVYASLSALDLQELTFLYHPSKHARRVRL